MYCDRLTLVYQYLEYMHFGMLISKTQHLWDMYCDSHTCVTKIMVHVLWECTLLTQYSWCMYYGRLILITQYSL